MSPWLLSKLCVHPACDEHFSLRQITLIQVSKLMDFCGMHPYHTSWETEEGLLVVHPLAGPLLRKWWHDYAAVCSLCQHQAESQHLNSLFVTGFSAGKLGISAALRHSLSFCDPRDPETMLSHLGFHPALPPEHISGKLLKVPILYSAACKTFWYLAYGGSLPQWFILGYITSDSCLHTSYLTSGCFSICRIVHFFPQISGCRFSE